MYAREKTIQNTVERIMFLLYKGKIQSITIVNRAVDLALSSHYLMLILILLYYKIKKNEFLIIG
jgi:hypothetical protein